jgi:hypothetical protein
MTTMDWFSADLQLGREANWSRAEATTCRLLAEFWPFVLIKAALKGVTNR